MSNTKLSQIKLRVLYITNIKLTLNVVGFFEKNKRFMMTEIGSGAIPCNMRHRSDRRYGV